MNEPHVGMDRGLFELTVLYFKNHGKFLNMATPRIKDFHAIMRFVTQSSLLKSYSHGSISLSLHQQLASFNHYLPASLCL